MMSMREDDGKGWLCFSSPARRLVSGCDTYRILRVGRADTAAVRVQSTVKGQEAAMAAVSGLTGYSQALLTRLIGVGNARKLSQGTDGSLSERCVHIGQY